MASSMRPAVRPLCLGAALALLAVGPAGAEEPEGKPDMSWIDPAELAAGEVALRLVKEGPVSTVDVAIEIDAPAEAVWNILLACDVAPEYVPNVVSCHSLEVLDDGAAELFVQKVRPAFFVPAFEHVFRLDYYPYRRIDLRGVTGPLRVFEGYWWIEPQVEGSLVLYYSLVVDPGIPVPRFFVRTTLRRDLPKVLAAVRDRAEAASLP